MTQRYRGIVLPLTVLVLVLWACGNNGLGVLYTSTIAYAGEDRTLQLGEITILDGSQSKHRDGDALTYTWIQLSGPELEISDRNASSLRVRPAVAGEFLIRLIVTDRRGVSSTDEVKLTVRSPFPEGSIDIQGEFED